MLRGERMSRKTKIGFGLVVIIFLTFGSWLLAIQMTSAEPLTLEEATNRVTELYTGDIVEVNEENTVYKITIKLDTGIYEVEIDKKTGEVGKMSRTKVGDSDGIEEQGTETPSNNQSNIEAPEHQQEPLPTDNPSLYQPTPVKQLTEQEAITIAKSKVAGEVEDIDIGQSGGVSYYLIEIENDEADREATVQINAISGEVMSITWDD